MNIGEIIILILALIISLAAFIISSFQFKEKGFLFNNAYLWASKKDREMMNKKPYYRQSAIVFLLVGIAFLLLAIEIAFTIKWMYTVIMLLTLSAYLSIHQLPVCKVPPQRSQCFNWYNFLITIEMRGNMKNRTIGIFVIICAAFTLILNLLMIIGIIGKATSIASILGMIWSVCILYLGLRILKKDEQ